MTSTLATIKDKLRWRWLLRKIGLYATVVIFLLIIIVPLYYIFITAFSPNENVFTKPLTWFPKEISFERFQYLLDVMHVDSYLLNTAVLTITSTVLATLFAFIGAYSIAKINPPGANFIMILLMASTMIPYVATVIPLYEMYRDLGLFDTFTGLLILYGSFMLPVSVWVLVNTMRSVPDEIEDAAKMDGASTMQVIFQVMLPICRSGIATMLIINFIAAWNQFFIPLVFATGDKSKVISLLIMSAGRLSISGAQGAEFASIGSTMAAGIIAIVPVFLLALVFQRQVTEGISGSVMK
jgi:ABC-type glycerol-3-phosphate transport system permease component